MEWVTQASCWLIPSCSNESQLHLCWLDGLSSTLIVHKNILDLDKVDCGICFRIFHRIQKAFFDNNKVVLEHLMHFILVIIFLYNETQII